MRNVIALLVVVSALWPGFARADGTNPSFNLVNRGRQVIREVYATPTGVDRWGQDRLTDNFVPAGATFPVRLPAGGCVYDLRVVYGDGKPEERRRLDTCQVDAVTFPGGRAAASNEAQDGGRQGSTNDPSFRLVNRGRSEINEVYVSEVGNDDWGRDRLGDDTVAVGRTHVVRLPSGTCRYDVRVVFDGGEAVERRRLDLCGITDLRVP